MPRLLSYLLTTSVVVSAVYADSNNVLASLKPAGKTVTTTHPAAPSLFAGESFQLTDESLDDVAAAIQDENISSMFAFGEDAESSTLRKRNSRSHSCKVMPGDSLWPADFVWQIFDYLLGGALIKASPLAASCYSDWPEYNLEKCIATAERWVSSDLHMADPTSIMLPLYQGRSCMPIVFNYTDTCTMGGYPTYVVNASTAAQIQLAVNFARNLNLRLVVKNTGHDFNGKAAGKGALSIWTHWLKDKVFLPEFKADNGYVGPAVKFGAGVQVYEAYEFAKLHGVSVIGGEGKTVGLGGGYTAGGGHSPLSSLYGMAADQVLAMEVVLADGRFITATSKHHADVFWMLRGGGGSTIGVVTSLTVRVFPKMPTTTVTFNFTVNDAPNVGAFWAGVQAYIDNIERLVDAGTYAYYYVGASAAEIGTLYPGDKDYYFRIESFVGPNMTIAQTKEVLAPWFKTLDSLKIKYKPWYNHADNFHDAWVTSFPQEYVGSAVVKTASRLLNRKAFADDKLRKLTYLAHKDAVEKGLFIAGFHLTGKGKLIDPPSDNAVLPAWRDTLAHTVVGKQWNATASWDVIRESTLFVTKWMDAFRDITPGSGAYMSEADLIEPNLQEAFYGVNYPRLYKLKQKYDPTGLFFALTAVGAEDWEVQTTDPVPASWNNNGRLCPVRK